MTFLFNKDTPLGLDERLLLELIDKDNNVDYKMIPLTAVESKIDLLKYGVNEEYIPIGTIEFVTKFINLMHGIKKENPIEIPEYLRTEEFLKRDYKIVKWDELPEEGNGNLFIKDVSTLKKFGIEVNTDYHNIKTWINHKDNVFNTELNLDKNSLYQISSIFDIVSEYRVYVLQGGIVNISNYNGDVTLFPDIKLIKKAVMLINYYEKWLKSYTLDVMVGEKGTALIEIHNFTSVGLYNTLWGNNLLYGYRDGIDYLINDNKELTEWSN